MGALVAALLMGAHWDSAFAQVKPWIATATHPQETDWWCWAASAEMVMDLLGHDVPQCLLSRKVYPNCPSTACPPATNPCWSGGWSLDAAIDPCANGAWPPFQELGFSCERTKGAALSWDELVKALNVGPVVYALKQAAGQAGHMMVAAATYVDPSGKRYVFNVDPAKPCAGSWGYISYGDYVAPSGGSHWADYYNISWAGVGSGRCDDGDGPGPGETLLIEPPSEPTLPRLGERFIRQSSQSVLGILNSFVVGLTSDQLANVGFASAGEAEQAVAGFPLRRFELYVGEVREFTAGDRVSDLLHPLDTLTFPLLVAGSVRSSVSVHYGGGSFKPAAFGDFNFIRSVYSAIDTFHPTGVEFDTPFILDVPGLNLTFVARGKGRRIWVRPIVDSPSYGLARSDVLSLEEMVLRIQPGARRYNGLPS